MTPHTRNPGGEAGAAGNVKALGGANDSQHRSLKAHENLAILHLAQRFRLSFPTARVVAELSGLGCIGRA